MNKEMYFRKPYLWPVGDGGMIEPNRVVAAGRWSSAPIRRSARQAKHDGRLIDLTYGKACIWVLYLDSGHLVLASQPMPVASIDIDESFNDEEDTPPWE